MAIIFSSGVERLVKAVRFSGGKQPMIVSMYCSSVMRGKNAQTFTVDVLDATVVAVGAKVVGGSVSGSVACTGTGAIVTGTSGACVSTTGACVELGVEQTADSISGILFSSVPGVAAMAAFSSADKPASIAANLDWSSVALLNASTWDGDKQLFIFSTSCGTVQRMPMTPCSFPSGCSPGYLSSKYCFSAGCRLPMMDASFSLSVKGASSVWFPGGKHATIVSMYCCGRIRGSGTEGVASCAVDGVGVVTLKDASATCCMFALMLQGYGQFQTFFDHSTYWKSPNVEFDSSQG
mmetsp:Transcript_23908/g.66464  ORF Transcript_23908/g.66464 Transcript_23908/m.66464 type:complete len:293 (+) Transcript_23908:1180-2058(+)